MASLLASAALTGAPAAAGEEAAEEATEAEILTVTVATAAAAEEADMAATEAATAAETETHVIAPERDTKYLLSFLFLYVPLLASWCHGVHNV